MVVKLSAISAGRLLPTKKIPGIHFCYKVSPPQGHSEAGRIRSSKKSNDFIRNRTRDFSACSIVPQPTTLLRATSNLELIPKIGIFQIWTDT
jgi:hypothetical protein